MKKILGIEFGVFCSRPGLDSMPLTHKHNVKCSNFKPMKEVFLIGAEIFLMRS